MLKKLLFLTLLISFPLSNFSQTGPDEKTLVREMFSAYGFCKGQELTLQNISIKFPDLHGQVLKARSDFQTTFGKSCDFIENLLTDEMKAVLNEKLQQLKMGTLTIETASNFIAKVQRRAKGEIESPWKETLLTFNPDFEENPALEFIRGFTKKYRTENHPKAKGINLEISVPSSWKAREGFRPNIVQFFTGQNGLGDATFAIQIRDFPIPKGVKVTSKDLDELFSAEGLKMFMDDNSTLLESKTIVIEGQKGGMIVYDSVGQRLDVRLKIRTLCYLTLFKGRMIMLLFSIGKTEDKMAETIREFNKNRPLFQLVANSLILLDKYK
jgi:hypothetical protein